MRLLREPLVHFLLLGAVLFAVYAIARGTAEPDEDGRIEIAESDIRLLADMFTGQWRRPPTEQELRRFVDARVREEVLYREAIAVGLDRDDATVRRRMVQKIELLAEDLAVLADPTDEELLAFFEERSEEYHHPPRVRFRQVYYSTDRRGVAAEEAARRALEEIRARDPSPEYIAAMGDSLLLTIGDVPLSPAEVERTFGPGFAAALFDLGEGWQGPIESAYGLHLVEIVEREERRAPELDEIRERVVADFDRDRAERARDAVYEGLAEKYDVRIDAEALRRVASETGAGGE